MFLTPSIQSSLWLKCCDLSQFFRKICDSYSEWVKGCKESGRRTPSWNAPAVDECKKLYAGELYQMSAFHTFCSEWLHFFLVFGTLVTLLWSLAEWIPLSIVFPVPENCYHQLSDRLIFIWTFSICLMIVCIYCFECFFGFNIHKWKIGFITCYKWCDLEIHHHLCGIALKKSQGEAILCIFCAATSIFGNHLVQYLW
jgi:hypothetical protein